MSPNTVPCPVMFVTAEFKLAPKTTEAHAKSRWIKTLCTHYNKTEYLQVEQLQNKTGVMYQRSSVKKS